MATVSMAIPRAAASHQHKQRPPPSEALFQRLRVKESKQVNADGTNAKLKAVEDSFKKKAVAGITAAAVAAPEVAQAAEGVTPSLKNFLVSIAAGGAVLLVIVAAIIAIAIFDPVKRK